MRRWSADQDHVSGVPCARRTDLLHEAIEQVHHRGGAHIAQRHGTDAIAGRCFLARVELGAFIFHGLLLHDPEVAVGLDEGGICESQRGLEGIEQLPRIEWAVAHHGQCGGDVRIDRIVVAKRLAEDQLACLGNACAVEVDGEGPVVLLAYARGGLSAISCGCGARSGEHFVACGLGGRLHHRAAAAVGELFRGLGRQVDLVGAFERGAGRLAGCEQQARAAEKRRPEGPPGMKIDAVKEAGQRQRDTPRGRARGPDR